MDVLAPPAPDRVSDALRSLRVQSTVFCLSHLRAPWSFHVEGGAAAKFHLLLAGRAWLAVDGQEPVALECGDVALLPRGIAHTVSDERGRDAIPLERILAERPPTAESQLYYGGSGSLTRLLCGGFTLAADEPASIRPLLPDVIHMSASDIRSASWLEPVLTSLDAEASAGRAGATAIVARLADVFLAEVLRFWLTDHDHADQAFIDALTDEPIRFALQILGERPAESWTLESLAAEVGMSRTILVTRFRSVVGDAPMRYLTRIRLSTAAAYLASSDLTLYEIARRSGYEDEGTLSRAFKREFGVAPGAYRSASRRPPAIILS
jgi:AraC family transcriptional regulator, alkane utilization regulator